MLLAVDVGNTNTKFALIDGDQVAAQFRFATQRERTADEYAVALTQLMALNGIMPGAVDRAILASVVPPTLFNLRRLCERYFRLAPLVVGEPGCKLGMEIRIDRPRDVGADRLVDCIGAHAQFPGAKIVLDFGTATTFNVVADNGDFMGGVICPGVITNIEALHSVAARLPRVDFARPARVVGRDTVSAMQSGTYWGYISLVEGMVARIRAEYGEAMTVVATGGHAELFAGGTAVIDHAVPDLTTRGFIELARRNPRVVGA